LFAEHLLVPAGIERELVIGDGQGAALDLRQVFHHNDRNFANALRAGRPKAPFTGNDPAVGANENWVYKAEFSDGGGDLRHLLGGVRAGVDITRDQSIHRPTLDLYIQIPHKFA
jgi:hypothetical protein